MSVQKVKNGSGAAGKQKRQSMAAVTLRRMKKNKMAVTGMIVLAILLVIAVIGPFIAPYPYAETDLYNTFGTPSPAHPFGLDELGRDILSRLMIGSKYSLSIGFISVAISSVIGIALGAVCGYFGGKIDTIIMRIMDVFSALPALIMAIAICAVLGSGFLNCIISISVSSIPSFVRMTRACVLNIRKMEYLEAATAINCTTPQIIVKHILPNVFGPLIVQMTMGVATGILAASNLSFIGLGVQPPTPEWSAMLTAGKNYIRNYPHMVVFPGVAIMITILALNMVGDGLRDAMDPKLKD